MDKEDPADTMPQVLQNLFWNSSCQKLLQKLSLAVIKREGICTDKQLAKRDEIEVASFLSEDRLTSKL